MAQEFTEDQRAAVEALRLELRQRTQRSVTATFGGEADGYQLVTFAVDSLPDWSWGTPGPLAALSANPDTFAGAIAEAKFAAMRAFRRLCGSPSRRHERLTGAGVDSLDSRVGAPLPLLVIPEPPRKPKPAAGRPAPPRFTVNDRRQIEARASQLATHLRRPCVVAFSIAPDGIERAWFSVAPRGQRWASGTTGVPVCAIALRAAYRVDGAPIYEVQAADEFIPMLRPTFTTLSEALRRAEVDLVRAEAPQIYSVYNRK